MDVYKEELIKKKKKEKQSSKLHFQKEAWRYSNPHHQLILVLSHVIKMENDVVSHRQSSSSFFSGCAMSPASCLIVHEEMNYSRIHHCSSQQYSKIRSGQRWRNLLRKLVRDSKTICGSRPLSFRYDAVSYSQNFDDGFHTTEEPRSQASVFPVVR